MPSPTEPQLDAPGAGLPWLEHQIANFMVKRGIRRASREEVSELLTTEHRKILDLATPLSQESASRRVLIRRLRGLEDSSRNWSVHMTLDHLRIVNTGIAGAITLLAQGKVPDRKASTASVKPSPEAGSSVIAAFTHSVEAIAEAAAPIADLRTPTRYAHPWFGPLDAAGWYFMSAFHLRLHRRQIEAILSGGN